MHHALEKVKFARVCKKLMKEVGVVTHYFSGIHVAAVKLSDRLKLGDTIRIKGNRTDFQQIVESMQKDKKAINQAEAGEEIGILVLDKVREGDKIYVVD